MSSGGTFEVTLVSPAGGCRLPAWHCPSAVPGRAAATLAAAHPIQSPVAYTPGPRDEHEPRCCLNIALLDLPIQPTTEVLGFRLGSSSSTQHLPFRFYDQCRRGSSDPTVQRSVFASVDKVPGKSPPPCAASRPHLGLQGWLSLEPVQQASFPSPLRVCSAGSARFLELIEA